METCEFGNCTNVPDFTVFSIEGSGRTNVCESHVVRVLQDLIGTYLYVTVSRYIAPEWRV